MSSENRARLELVLRARLLDSRRDLLGDPRLLAALLRMPFADALAVSELLPLGLVT